MPDLRLEEIVSSSSSELEYKSEIVRAGAGAGKTTALTKKVMQLALSSLDKKNKFPKLIVTTFTKKATQELRERLMREAIEETKKRPELEQRLIQFVSSRSQLHISTIHGVFSRFLREIGHLLGMDSAFRVLDYNQANLSSRKILKKILVENQDLVQLLEHFNVNQLVNMLESYREQQAHYDSFEPLSEGELLVDSQNYIKGIVQDFCKTLETIQTSTSNEKWQIATADYLKSSREFLTDMSHPDDFANLMASFPRPRFSRKPVEIFSEDLNIEFSRALENIKELSRPEHQPVNVKIWANCCQRFQEAAILYVRMTKDQIFKTGNIRMVDLELLVASAIREQPEMIRLFSDQWEHWLIDEFQDTSPLQIRLLDSLIAATPVYYVGDPQQSIYLFRGARSEIFAERENQLRLQSQNLSSLNVNYRSCPELLCFLNDFFASVRSTPFLPMQPKIPVQDCQKRVAHFAVLPEDESLHYAPLAQHIIDGIARGEQFENYCILARKNDELIEIARYLESFNIPTHLHSSQGFFQRREILDILIFLKFLINPYDNTHFLALIRSPWFRIADNTITELLRPAPIVYWEHFSQQLKAHDSIQLLVKYREMVTAQGYFNTVLRAIVEVGMIDSSYMHDTTGRRESNIWKLIALIRQKEKQSGFNYSQFVDQCLDGGGSSDGQDETDAVAALEPDRVNLMTIHKSKGLKFKHVLVPNIGKRPRLAESHPQDFSFVINESSGKWSMSSRMGDDLKLCLPHAAIEQLQKLSERENEEHLRLLYVALTRAAESVHLSWSNPVDSNSWLAQTNWDLSPGLHQKDNYCYLVTEEISRPSPLQVTHKNLEGVRSALAISNSISQKPRISVTRYLEKMKKLVQYQSNGIAADELRESIMAPVFGLRLHTFFERLKYDSTYSPRNFADQWLSTDKDKFISATEYILNLQEPPLRKLIEVGYVEWGFHHKLDDCILEGQIDLWGEVDGVTWVVDYKSGSEKNLNSARLQLKLYAGAIQAIKPDAKIRLAVIFRDSCYVEDLVL